MIMRYQRISPDSLPLSNGKRTSSTSNPIWKSCKEDEERVEINGNVNNNIKPSSTFEGKGLSRFRSPSRNSQDDHHIGNGNGGNVAAIGPPPEVVPNSPPTATTRNHQNLENTNNGVVGVGVGGGDTFLQWGHRKRSRCSRGTTPLTDETTSSSTSNLQFQSTKLQRRSSVPNLSSPNGTNLMPPPSLTAANGIARGPIIKPQTKTLSSTHSPVRRNSEDRSAVGGGGNKSPPRSNIVFGGGGGSSSSSRAISSRSRAGKKSTTFLEKKNPPCSSSSTRDEKMNGCSLQHQQQQQQNHQEAPLTSHILSPPQQGGCTTANDDNTAAARPAKLGGGGGGSGSGGGEKANNGGGEVNEWPRVYIPLTRKEKEEDFLAMKGTKLPHRPKKRPKAVERILQYCFPGMWLSDLPRGRYEVREKKCPRKQPKRRGLKGMESMESDSE
ncbi:hypothetical protein M9H77_36385 [Catharanthus roseus]|uniref:Uncharacterized protein n=1 Tax=Catharanthus roseus TaxID=4058 RepID=A0ACB9ZVD0_CATRO|nr:hypothetical protein M9H77_36385 [Catharanthus roseus]